MPTTPMPICRSIPLPETPVLQTIATTARVASSGARCQIAAAGAPDAERWGHADGGGRSGVAAQGSQQRFRGDPAELAVVAVERRQRRIEQGGPERLVGRHQGGNPPPPGAPPPPPPPPAPPPALPAPPPPRPGAVRRAH